MAISFPSNPTLNDIYTYNSITWTYTGTAWSKSTTAASVLPTQATNSGKFLTTDGTAASWGTISVTPAAISDQPNTSTGYLDLPMGTTAQRPVSPPTGSTRINSTTNTFEIYYNDTWSTIATVGWVPQTQINTTSMAHSLVIPAGSTGLQGQGSSVITTYGAAAPSVAPGSVGYSSGNFSTHGGHSGSNSYPSYWAVYLGTAKAVNQLITYVHGNSWGHFVLEGSNDSGNTGNFATAGTWTPITFTSSNNGSNTQNMGGNGSGRGDGTSITCTYSNSTGYLAYRVKMLDSSAPGQAIGTTYAGSGGYSWQLNRV